MLIKSKKFKIFDSDALKNFHKRIFFSIIIFSCFYFVAIFRIGDVMVFKFNKNEFKDQVQTNDRGKIYDRNGQLLASNIKSYSLFVNASKMSNKFEIAEKLSPILNLKKGVIYKKINSNKKFVYIKRNISPIEHQKIINLGEISLQTELEKNRIYPFRNTASHLVGFVDIDNQGKAGVEKGFDDLLKNNQDLYLTIDINLQNAVRNELFKTVKIFSAESGSVIIMDIQNSEILSLINYPDFDPNNYSTSTFDQRLNRILQSNYEMGSTFKPLTVAMGMDIDLIKKDMSFDVAKQKNFFKLAGFFDQINIDLIEAAYPLGNTYNWGLMETMTIGYGYGFAITPMHLAVAYNAILNEGKKTKPKIILNDNDDSFTQIIKKETSKYIASLLKAVIEESEYTGPRVKIKGYDIGGKTGTSELTNSIGDYDKDLNRTIFIGALPMSKPKYLVLTFIDKPKRIKEYNYSITSATVNAPLVKNIIKKIIEILKVPKYENKIILNAATSLNYNQDNAIN